MKTNNKVPKLRFPEFSGEWEIKELGEIANRISKKNFNFAVEKVLTNSALDGVVEQSSFFESKITTKGNLDNYFILDFGDFVYNPRISKFAPVGPISRNNIEKGIVSPLYFVFRFKNSHTDYYDYYFHTMLWHVYIKASANKGARFDRISISAEKFMGIPIPYPSQQEQQKIADCLASLDELLDLEEKKLSALQKYKKGLLQKIFSQEIRFKDDNGNNFLDWKEKKLGELGIFYRGHSYNANDVSGKGLLVLRSNNINNVINYNELQFVTKPCNIELLLQNEDIVICMSNGSKKLVGKSATFIVTDKYNYVTVGAFCSIFRSNSKLAKYLFQLNNYKEQINFILEGANINNLKNSELELFKFLFPVSSQEQQKIADFLSSVDELIENQELKIEQFKQHKKGLLQGLFPNINGVEDVN